MDNQFINDNQYRKDNNDNNTDSYEVHTFDNDSYTSKTSRSSGHSPTASLKCLGRSGSQSPVISPANSLNKSPLGSPLRSKSSPGGSPRNRNARKGTLFYNQRGGCAPRGL